MTDILAEILTHKRAEVEQARAARPLGELKSSPTYYLPRRNFYGAVTVPRRNRPNLIAEIKRSSPSAGLIREDFDPTALARCYENAGAAALSILTDERYFGGQLDFIQLVKSAVGLPVLRKDFLVDEYQLHESRAVGADAVLIIVEAAGVGDALELVHGARELDLWVLLEVHTRAALLELLACWPEERREGVLLGINNRDLKRQCTDLATTEDLAEIASPGLPIVSESGIRTRRDVDRMFKAGARAILVGETLLREEDPATAVRALLG